VTGLPRPTTPVRLSSVVLVFFGILVSNGPSRAVHPLKPESPAALLLEARDTAGSIEDRAERSAALDPVVVAQIALDPPQARETLRIFPKLPSKLNYLAALAAAYAKNENVSETERIYAEIVVEDQSSRAGKLAAANALGQLAMAYANKGNVEEAFRTLERLKDRTKQEPPAIVGDVTAYLVEAQAKQGNVQGAVKTALSIAGENPYPLMAIVKDLVRKGNAQKAQEIVAGLDDGAKPYAQWGIVQAQITQGRLTDAQVTASAIKPGHAKASALLELAHYHLQHGAKQLALLLLQEAETPARSTVNDWTRADILWRIAAETARAGDAARAIAIAKSIEKEGHRDSAISDIAKAQATRGDFADAFNTASLLKQTPPTSVPGVSRYDVTLSEILVQMVKAGKGTEAKDTAAKFQDADIRRSWLYSGIARAYADLGNVKEARSVLALAETEDQRSARRKELRHIAEKRRLGSTPADDTRLQELVETDIEIRPGLDALAEALARSGDLTGAMAIADQLNHPAHRLDVIKTLTALHVHSGRKEQTVRWARHLSSASEKVFALVGIASALSQDVDKRKKANPARSH